MFELFCRWYILGAHKSNQFVKEYFKLQTHEPKDKIKQGKPNHVIFIGIHSEKKTWIGGTYEFYFADWRAHVKTKQSKSLNNDIISGCKWFVMWFYRGETPLWCFYVWDVNVCVCEFCKL